MRDKIMRGAMIGLLADAVKLSLNYLAFLLKFTPIVFWQITASRFLEKKDLFKPLALVIGAVADLFTSAFLGIVFLYATRYMGKKYLLLKGLGFGVIVWVGLFGTVLRQTGIILQLDVSSIAVTLIAHAAYGVALGFFTILFQRKKVK